MTNHHDPKSACLSKKPVLQWSLEDEVQFYVEKSRQLNIIPKGENLRSRDTTTTTTTTTTSPTTSTSNPTQICKAVDADPKTIQEIKEWFSHYQITAVNTFLRHFTVAELNDAADEFEEAIAAGVEIKKPGGFFWYLLNRR